MATCPSCRASYTDPLTRCPADGEPLLPDEAFASADQDLPPGRTVGEYQVEAKLGEGGFGSVYRAVHPLIGKTVAVKVLNRQYSSNPQMVSRFIAEARAVNQIRNRNIIDIFSFGRLDDGRQFYVMELLEGMPLDRYLKQRGRLPPEEAIPILRSIARALDAAHAAGIAHRDLKPENVFLTFEDDSVVFPKLLDFGIAKLLGDSTTAHKTRTGAPMGTPYYMSPEQCRGSVVDHRTDLYSFGILAHELLTGRLPFTGNNVMDLLFQQTTAPPPPVSSVAVELSAALDGPILHMLAKEASARPESVGAGLEALARAAESAGYAVRAAPLGSEGGGRRGKSSLSARAAASMGTELGAATLVDHGAATPAELAALSQARTVPLAGTATQTSLGTSASHAPSRRRRSLAAAASAALALGVGVATFVASRPKPMAEPALATPIPAAPATGEAAAPPPTTPPLEVEPAPPAEVELVIQSTPKDVEIYAGAEKLGTAPGPLRVRRSEEPLRLTLKAAGYVSTEIAVTPSANAVVSATLVRAAAPRPTRAARPEVEF